MILQEGENQTMAQSARRISGEAESLIREATEHPVVVELNGKSYQVTVRDLSSPSPFTVDSVYASIATANGTTGEDISAAEFNQMMEDAHEDYATYLTKKMKNE